MPPHTNTFDIVYLLTHPSIPCLVKICMTTRDNVEPRMKELYVTGVPAPFERQYACKVAVSDCATIEKALHTAFAPDRINANRDFFRIQPEQAEAILALFHREDVTHEVENKFEI